MDILVFLIEKNDINIHAMQLESLSRFHGLRKNVIQSYAYFNTYTFKTKTARGIKYESITIAILALMLF